MRVLKILAAFLGIVIVVVIIAGILLASFFDPNDYKDYAQQWVEERTGRSFTIDGDIKLSYYPWLAIETGAIELGNAEGFGDTPFATAQRVSARVRLLPLLQRQIEIGTVQIDGLELDLARRDDGTTNWNDLLVNDATASTNNRAVDADSSQSLGSLGIEAVELRDAQVIWREGSDEPRYIVSKLSLTTGSISPSQPVDIEADFNVLDVASQLNGIIAVQSTVAVLAGGNINASESSIEYAITNGQGANQGRGLVEVTTAQFVPGVSAHTGPVTMTNTVINPPIGSANLATALSWSTLDVDLQNFDVNVGDLVTEADGLRASWQIVGEDLMGEAAAVRGSVVLDETPVSAFVRVLNIELPPEIAAQALGNLSGNTSFAMSFDTQDVELANTSLTALGINVRTESASISGENISASIAITPFRPNAALRGIIAAYVPQGIDTDAIGRIALNAMVTGTLNNLNISNLRAELLNANLGGNLQFGENGTVITGRIASERFSPDELLAVLGDLITASISPQSAGMLQFSTGFSYDTQRSSASLREYHLEAFGLVADGELSASNLSANAEFEGTTRINNLDPRDLLNRFSLAVPQTSDPTALRSANVSTRFNLTPNAGSFEDLVVRLDESRITGSFDVSNFADPLYRFVLQADTLDVDRYLPPQTPPGADNEAPQESDTERRAGDIELSNEALNAVNVDGDVRVANLRLSGMDFQNVATHILVGNGLMNLDSAHANLYGGTFDGRFRVDTTSQTPTMSLQGDASSLQLEPLITALAGEANFSGTATFNIDLHGSGPTITDTLHSAAGTMGFELTSGAISGFNIDKTLCRAFNRLRSLPAPTNQPDRTPFELVRGNATVTDGIARSSDLFARAGSVEVRGRGNIALAEQLTDYTFDARLARSVPIQGCQEMDRIIGEDFPLVMKGPVTAPDIAPDYGEVLKRIVEDRVRDNLQERLLDRLINR